MYQFKKDGISVKPVLDKRIGTPDGAMPSVSVSSTAGNRSITRLASSCLLPTGIAYSKVPEKI